MSDFRDQMKAAINAAGGGSSGQLQSEEQIHQRLAPLNDPNPIQGVIRFFARSVQFSGRASRAEFIYGLAITVAVFAGGSMAGNISAAVASLGILAGLAVVVPFVAVSARRLQDTGRPGLLILGFFLPVVITQIVLLWFLFKPSDTDNQYGPTGV